MRKSLLALLLGLLILGGVVYVALPITYTTESDVGYSARYYELLEKGALTEAERAELQAEKKKTNQHYAEKYGLEMDEQGNLIPAIGERSE